jgi:hypothetical protein
MIVQPEREVSMAYTLPAGIISEARSHHAILMDMVAWMERQDGLFDVMNGLAMQSGNGDGWSESDYVLLPDATDSDCAVEIFDIMNDLAGFLPEGHMWGFSEGRIGIFECRITIEVVEEKPEPKFRFLYADPGKVRTYYRALYGAKLLYCFQDDGRFGDPAVNFYMCSKDGEPDVLCVMPENHELDVICKP